MDSTLSAWEYPLLTQAHIAIEAHTPLEPLNVSQDILDAAFQRSESITRQHSRTFYLAGKLLPRPERRAAHALYSFCLTCDDLVDDASASPKADLEIWRWRSLNAHPNPDDQIALAWADTRARYNIPRQYAEQLIAGVARDLTTQRYSTFSELSEYCYGVASTVGLMIMHIIGYKDNIAIPYAIKLGVALQLTNILRDVAEDWQMGRLYLPQDELTAFDLTEADIAAGQIDHRWRAFMRFQIARARRLYTEAMPGIALLSQKGRFAIAAAAELYQGILDDIEANDYDVFSRRAHLTTGQKLKRLPGIGWRANISHYKTSNHRGNEQ